MGKTLDELRTMPESDLQLYAAYFSRYGTPAARAEFYAAQTAFYVAACMGGYKGGIHDFILPDPDAPAAETEYTEEDDGEEADWRDNPLFAGFQAD